MDIRSYQHDRDYEDCLRIYREVGWVSESDHEKAVAEFVLSGRGLVTELHGSAECLVVAHAGTLRYVTTDLPMSAVGSVTTSRIARKQGYASHLTAQLLAQEAAHGFAIAILGIFEQGYYNQLGFGNGSYQYWCSFDPSMLELPVKAAVPVRLGREDWQAMHEGRLRRVHVHGSCSLTPSAATHADVMWSENGFGLGYLDTVGNVTHHFWCSPKGEHGPYRIHWLAYQTKQQFLELLALIKSLGDQVRSVSLIEPPNIQLQDLIRHPIKMREMTKNSPYENRMTAGAFWQARILNLEACLAATQLTCPPLRFNLSLIDPVAPFLSETTAWNGAGGDYVITLGPQSSAEVGTDSKLPTMHASINAFTRLWLGIRPATSLSWTDDLQAPETLLRALDLALHLPNPTLDWDF